MWEPIPDRNTTTDQLLIHNAIFHHYNRKGSYALAWVYQKKNDEP